MSGTSGVNLGTAYGRIILDASGARSGADDAEQTLRQKVEAMGSQIRNLGANLTVLTAPIAAFGFEGVKAAGDFDGAMRELQARTGLSADEMDRMRQAALDMGAQTVFSASDAANSLLQLTTSGLSADEALGVLPSVLAGAAASGENLANVADWTTDIMAAYGLEVDQAGMVIEALNAGAGASSATFGDLALGFQNVGGMAALMGLSVEDTTAILATFSENGIKGAEAGTQLRSMLNNMTRDTDAVQGMWDRLELSLYDATGAVRPLNDVIREMNLAMEDMSDQERLEVIQTLGGAYGQLGLNALLTSEGFGAMSASMDGAASAADVAAARMGGWNGAMEALKGSVETLQITALTPFMNNVLTPLVEKITEVVNKVTEWATANPELAQKFVMIGAALVVLGPLLVMVGQFIISVTAIVGLLGAAFGLLSVPVWLAIGAVAALAAAWATDFGGIRTKTMEVVGAVRERLSELRDTFSEAGGASGIASSARSAVETALGGIRADFSAVTSQISGQFWPAVQIATTVAQIPGGTQLIATAAGTAIASSVSSLDLDFSGLETLVSSDFWGAVRAGLMVIGMVVGGPAGLVAGVAGLLVSALESDFLGIRTSIEQSGIIDSIRGALEGLWTRIQEIVAGLFGGGGGGGVSGPVEQGDSGFGGGGMFSGLIAAFTSWVPTAIQNLLLALPGILTAIITWILEQIPTLATNLLNFAAEFVNWVGPAITDILPKLGEFLGSVIQWILEEFIPAIVAEVPNIVTALIQFVDDAITQVGPALLNFLTAIGNFILNELIPGVVGFAAGIGEGIVNGIRNGIERIWSDFKDWITGKVQGALTGVTASITGGETAAGVLAQGGVVIPGRALGGPVSAGLPYLVGEQGPELFVPRGSGSVIPNEGLRGMGGTTINIDVGGLMLAPIAGSSPQEQAVSFVDALEEELGRRGW